MPGRKAFYERRRANGRRWAATNARAAPAVAIPRSQRAACEPLAVPELPVLPVAGGPGAGVLVTVAVGVLVTVAVGVPVVVAIGVAEAVADGVVVTVAEGVPVVVAEGVPVVVAEGVPVVVAKGVPVVVAEGVPVVVAVADTLWVAVGVAARTWFVTVAVHCTSEPPPFAESLHWATCTSSVEVMVDPPVTVQANPTLVPPFPEPLH